MFTSHMGKLHPVQQFLMSSRIVFVFMSFNEISLKGIKARYSIYGISVELYNQAFKYQVSAPR